MIDNLSILLSHALLLYMFYHVIYRDDIDDEAPPPKINLDADPSRFRPIRSIKKAKEPKPAIGDAPPGSPYRRPLPNAKARQKPIGGRRDA